MGKEALPEWSTPVFIVDQEAKGLLGRMVRAYGPVNSRLEITTFPSADPQVAFDIAAFKKHHTVVDAIWGYTQFLLDDSTKRLLRPIHLLRVFLLRVLESDFPGDSL